MQNRDDLIRCAGLLFGLATVTGFGCGVQGHPIQAQAGTAGVFGSTSGAAGVTGAAGATSGAAGTFAGAAGATGVAGTAGDTGAAGSTGSAGTFGGAGATGAAGNGTMTGAGGASSGAAGSGAAGTAPSGITINIGGVNVPKENAIAFIHFGHSNMAGRGVDPAATRPYFFDQTDPHAWMYHSGKGFQPAIEPGTAGDGGNRLNGMVSGGPGTPLVKQAAALAPGKYFISVGFGRSSAYCSQFLPGALYYNQVITGAKELKGKVTFAAIVILLGITERHGTQADIDNYPQCIEKLVTAVRTDLGEPNLPLLINDYEMGTTGPNAPTSAFAMAIRPKILLVPTMPNLKGSSVVIPTDNPIVQIQPDNSSNDWHHFSLDGHKEYTRRILQTMQDKGWWHW
jgi:hypothetical protein